MAYSRQQAIELWFEFDNTFHFQTTAEVRTAYQNIHFDFDLPLNAFDDTRAAGTFPASFLASVQPFQQPLSVLSRLQLASMDKYFGGDADSLRLAFEDFGQGILFDDRRPAGVKLHTMDSGGPANPPIGYHRWHGFARAFIVLGLDVPRWTVIDRFIGLAWAIQSILKPVQDQRNNPELPDSRLESLRVEWLAKPVEKLDAAFDNKPYPVGIT
jgi:hypothetical protein